MPRNGEAMGKPSVMFWNMKPTSTTRAAPERPTATPREPKTSPSVRFWNPIPIDMTRASWVGVRPFFDLLSARKSTRNPAANAIAKSTSLETDEP